VHSVPSAWLALLILDVISLSRDYAAAAAADDDIIIIVIISFYVSYIFR